MNAKEKASAASIAKWNVSAVWIMSDSAMQVR
jgi:hypothetical protein